MDYSTLLAQLLQAQGGGTTSRRRSMDYFAPPRPDMSADALDEAALNQPKSNIMTKAMSGMQGFMSTYGGGGMFSGGEAAGAPGADATGAAGASAVPEGTAGAPASSGTDLQTLLRKSAGNYGDVEALMRTAGVDPSTAAYTQDAIALLQDRDPNKGAKNIGRIAGLVARLYTG